MSEKVSVIIPCYNGEKFVDRSLQSIYIQDYTGIELIVVDDGSTDDSRSKIYAWEERYVAKGHSLKYHFQENQGPGSAINAGLKLVTGDYITLLDVDDEYLPGAISERVEYLQKNKDVDVVRSNGWVVKGEHRHLFIYDEKEKMNEDIFLSLLRGETNNWAGSYMVRSEALFRFYPNREIYQSRYGQNLQFLLPLVYKKKCGYLDKPHMNYIQQPNSLSQTTANNIQKDLENLRGYYDIRNYMLNLIVCDTIEKETYAKEIESAYWKSIMQIALMSSDKDLMKNAYQKKKEYQITIDDKITYYALMRPYLILLLKVVRKAKKWLRRIL